MRDLDRLVLAEDDRELAEGLRVRLTRLGGYDVLVTRSGGEAIPLLRQSNAFWLILDLELEDGYAGDLVGEVRRVWGRGVYILVLSGYYERYPEHDVLEKGADTFLRKPYSPKSLTAQITVHRARIEGAPLEPTEGLKLRIGEGVLDLDRGSYTRGNRQETLLGDKTMRFLRHLASARDEAGWAFVDRTELILHLWGEGTEYEMELYHRERHGLKLRQLKHRTTRLLGLDPIDIYKGGRTSKYRLSPEKVALLEG